MIRASYELNNLGDHLKTKNEIRYFAHEAAILAVTEALEEQMERLGLSRAELARRIERTPGFVSQVLNGGRNMTVKTIADIALAMGLQVRGIEFTQVGQMTVPAEAMDGYLDHCRTTAEKTSKSSYRELRVVSETHNQFASAA